MVDFKHVLCWVICDLYSLHYRFLKKSQLVIPENIRRAVKSSQKNEIVLQPDFFDQMQIDVEYSISSVTYRNFLQSDMYLRYIQNQSSHQQQQPPQAFISTSSSSSNSSEEQSKLISRSSTLPTLHEDTELLNYEDSDHNTSTIGRKGTMTMALTKDALLATERRRLEMRPAGWVSLFPFQTKFGLYLSFI